MDGVEQYADQIRSAVECSKELAKHVRDVSGYKLEQVLGTMISLFNRCCPFNVEDRIRLTKSFTTEDKSHGWYHCQHFLVKGAKGTIVKRDYRYKSEKFDFLVEFDEESWISSIDGEVHLVEKDRRCVYSFTEEWLERC